MQLTASDDAVLFGKKRRFTRPPLPASAVDYWHASLGVYAPAGVVTSWTSQIRSLAAVPAAPANSPVYAADGANFGGKKVVQCAVTGSLSLAIASISPAMFATGTRPYVMYVGRLRDPAASLCGILYMQNRPALIVIPVTNGEHQAYIDGTQAVVYKRNQPSAPEIVEIFLDAAGVATSVINGAVIKQSGTGLTLAGSAAALTLGTYAGSYPCDLSVAALICCSSVPTEAERTALREWAFAEWSFPQSYERILGPLLGDYWHASYGFSLSGSSIISWGSQLLNTLCSAASVPTRPSLLADGSTFGALPIVQTANTGSKCLVSPTISTPLALAAAFPYVLSVFRTRSTPDGRAWELSNAADAQAEFLLLSDPSITLYEFYTRNSTTLNGITVSQNPATAHVSELYWDAATGRRVSAVNGGSDVLGAILAGGTKNSINVVGIGCIPIPTVSQVTNTSLALLLFCASVPTVAQRAALVALARSQWSI